MASPARSQPAHTVPFGFVQRGGDELTATLAAELAVTVVHTSLARWLARDDDRALASIVTETLDALRTLAADG